MDDETLTGDESDQPSTAHHRDALREVIAALNEERATLSTLTDARQQARVEASPAYQQLKTAEQALKDARSSAPRRRAYGFAHGLPAGVADDELRACETDLETAR